MWQSFDFCPNVGISSALCTYTEWSVPSKYICIEYVRICALCLSCFEKCAKVVQWGSTMRLNPIETWFILDYTFQNSPDSGNYSFKKKTTEFPNLCVDERLDGKLMFAGMVMTYCNISLWRLNLATYMCITNNLRKVPFMNFCNMQSPG